MAVNQLECELLVTNASVLRRQSYIIVLVEGVFKHEYFTLHTVAKCYPNDNSPLIGKVEALRTGDTVDAVVELVARRTKDNRPCLAFELVDILK